MPVPYIKVIHAHSFVQPQPQPDSCRCCVHDVPLEASFYWSHASSGGVLARWLCCAESMMRAGEGPGKASSSLLVVLGSCGQDVRVRACVCVCARARARARTSVLGYALLAI
mmetsp:Transcript_21648/g.56511  ORF Transcript_21648/g.56511 Transcript_21648/m.56511 type:complete len:112 (-) Transcript_21648:410-745(-)